MLQGCDEYKLNIVKVFSVITPYSWLFDRCVCYLVGIKLSFFKHVGSSAVILIRFF